MQRFALPVFLVLCKLNVMTHFIELNRLYTTQLTVVNLQLVHQQHVSALFGHH